jgi:C4-type Zn-finger protein
MHCECGYRENEIQQQREQKEGRKIRVDVARWRWSYWRDLRRRLGETRETDVQLKAVDSYRINSINSRQ